MSNENYIAVIGPPRSGTSWLYHYFRTHPGVFAPMIKELNWFNIRCGVANPRQVENVHKRYTDMKARFDARGDAPNEHLKQRKERKEMRDDADFKAFYQNRVSGDMPFVDVSPSYAALPTAGFQQIANTFKNAKIVILLRNPADRAWSLVHHARKNHAPNLAINDVIVQLARRSSDPISRDLAQIYASTNAALNTDHIHCLFTEDLFEPETQQSTLDQLSAFMGCAPCPVGDFDFTKNRGTYDAMPPEFEQRVTSYNQSDMHWAEQLMGRLPDRWQESKAKAGL